MTPILALTDKLANARYTRTRHLADKKNADPAIVVMISNNILGQRRRDSTSGPRMGAADLGAAGGGRGREQRRNSSSVRADDQLRWRLHSSCSGTGKVEPHLGRCGSVGKG